jgi:hypothetical protein
MSMFGLGGQKTQPFPVVTPGGRAYRTDSG